MKTVAVYGSSAVQPHELDYVAAYDLGKALGAAGYAVMTGGYAGVMEAVSRGASEAGGHVIGVTTDIIEAHRLKINSEHSGANQWVVDEIRHPTLRERLMHLVLEADAYVVMPGGLGTLHELVTVWELVRVGEIPPRPVLCYGAFWADMLVGLRYNQYLNSENWDVIQFVETQEAVLQALKNGVSHESQ